MLNSIILRRPHFSSLCLSLALVISFTATARAQLALDGFDPNANGSIRAIVVQPDGKVLIGGDFTTLSPNGGAAVTRNHIARLNADGTLDIAFNPNANGTVYAIAIQADGKILVGGNFNGTNSIGGQTRNYIARLEAVGGSAGAFDPNANGQVLSIVVQPDGKILVGGQFNGVNSIGGQARNRFARLDAATGLADSWNPNDPNIVIFVPSIVVQADGKILVGGDFTTIGGQPRNRIARLDAVTGLADSWNPNANNTVRSIAIQADGKIIAGGDFSGANSIGGQARGFIARLDAATGLADSFNPNANNGVNSIKLQADGKILVGGNFLTVAGQTRNRIARLDPSTGMADSFDPNANNNVISMAIQPDGKLLVGGVFTSLTPNGGATVTRNNIARMEINGQLDQTLVNLNITGNNVLAIAVQPDGKILIGGSFSNVLGVVRSNIARLNADGTLDSAFNPNANIDVYAIAVQADGKILVGGTFTTIGGQTRNRIARLDATTGLADSFNPNSSGTINSIAIQTDGKILAGGSFAVIGGEARNNIARLDATGFADSFDPNANSQIQSLAVQGDGKILAGGSFTNIGGQVRLRIARLDATTGLADPFNPNANSDVISMAVQADGKILVGGNFTIIGGQTRNRIARLDPITGAADSFDPNANNYVDSFAVQADGKILAGGNFGVLGGQARNRIARLHPDGTLDAAFSPNADGLVRAIALQADGKILVGGNFTIIGGYTRNYFARLSNDTAAQQNLAVTQSDLTWTRGGSSPQFTRVTFELSLDNVNYTPVGDGTPAGSNWTLTGLNLPTGQNIYIRARGYYRGGYQNGSESIGESIRNGFLDGPTPTATNTATNTPTNTPTNTSTSTPTATSTNTATATPTATPCTPIITPLNEDFESGTLNTFSSVVTQCNPGGCGWGSVTSAAHAGTHSAFAPDIDGVSDQQLTLSSSIPIPAGATGATLTFWHRFGFETNGLTNYDGAVLEVSINGGASWQDADFLITSGGYNGMIGGNFGNMNPLNGRQGWVQNPNGTNFVPVTVNLLSYAGVQNLRIRFREGTDISVAAAGWWIDDVLINITNACPTATPTSTATNTPTNTPTSTPTATPAAAISGTVTYGNAIPAATRFVSNVLISGAGSPSVSTTTAFPGGTYTLTGFGAGSYAVTPTKMGGVNGAISSFDAAKIALHVAGPPNPQLNATQLIVADVSNNGSVTSFDAGMVAKFVAGPPYAAPGIGMTSNWKFIPVNRNYALVTSNIAGEDYSALLMGEVSGNWTNTGARPANGPERNATVSLPNLVTPADKEIIVPVNIQGAANKGIISYEFDLRYDPAVIQPLENAVDVAGTVSRGLMVVTNPNEPGLVRVVVYGLMPLVEDGVLLYLRFVAVGSAGWVSPLAFERVMFNEGEPRVMVTDGRVELYGPASE